MDELIQAQQHQIKALQAELAKQKAIIEGIKGIYHEMKALLEKSLAEEIEADAQEFLSALEGKD